MPPWLPAPNHGEFKDERRLSKAELDLIQTWADNGTPEGDPADLPPIPRWPEGWQLGDPDLVLTLPEPFELPASGPDVWRNFVIPTSLATNRYVRAMEFRPGNKCVHHAAMRLDRTPQSRLRDEREPGPGFAGITPPETARAPAGHMLNWLPGRAPYQSPDGMAWPLEQGADLIVQLHMQTTGKAERVQPAIGFYFTDQAPTNSLSVFALMVRTIDIPPGAQDYTISDSYRLPVDVDLLWINPHAHYLARQLKGMARLPHGEEKPLLLIQRWDFNWQGDYTYRDPVFLPKGTELIMEFTYDNSTHNPHNPNHPPKRVQFGQQSTDEMGELWLQVLARTARDRAILENDLHLKTLAEMTRYYEFRLQQNPEDSAAHARLGFVAWSNRQIPEAIERLKTAIRLSPSDDESRVYLGMIWLEQKQHAAAELEFKTALDLNPNNYLAHGNLGLLHLNLKRLTEAEAHLRAALRLNPNDSTARENLRRVLSAEGKRQY